MSELHVPGRYTDSATQLLRRIMIIARRLLKLVDKDAEDKFVEIRIFSPERRAESWWCDYEIDWPAGQWKSAGAGIDAIQAMRLAFEKIGTEIYTSTYHRSGHLIWDKPGNGYGFPVPKNIRHMLVGDDALYD